MRKWVGLTVLLAACSAPPVEPVDGGKPDGGPDGGGGGGGGDGGGSYDGGLPLNVACTVLNARRCEYLRRCGLISEPAVRDCLAWLQATSCGPSKWQARVEPGVATLRYDAVLAQACAEAWLTRACGDFGVEPSACRRASQETFLVPNAFAGQACYDGYAECTDTNVCRGMACPRSCQPKGLVGEVCRQSADCKANLFCKVTSLATGSGVCTAYGLADAGCDADQPCSPSPALVCSAGRCASPPPASQPCLGTVCDESAWCLAGQCKARLASGGDCTDDAQCQAQLLCEVLTGKCVARTLTSLGSSCGLRQTCPLGAVCLGATPTALGECQPPRDAGASCLSSNDCQSHLACAGVDGGLALGCGPRQPDGMRCTEHRDCQLLSICRQATCVRLPTTGDSCASTASCLFGPCVSADAGSVCTEPFGPGLSCASDSDCASRRCVTGKCLAGCAP